MSLFKRKPRTTARARLADPEFPCNTAPGAVRLRVDYDPALWVRLPTIGVDRTAWIDQVREAYAEDLEWALGSPEDQRLEKAATIVADTELSYTASFAAFPRGVSSVALAHVHALDEELMTLEYADPSRILDNGTSAKPQSYPQGWHYNDFTVSDPSQPRENYLRGHKRLDTDPPIHLVGLGRFAEPSISGSVLLLFARSKVVMADGRVL